MRWCRVWGWCAALSAAARAPCGGAQSPPADPAAWINEVDLKDEFSDHVYVEVVIRQAAHVPEVAISSLRVQFFSAGGRGSRRKFTATTDPLPAVTANSGSHCARDPHSTQWCAGTDNDLYTIRRTYVERRTGQMNTQLPNVATEWGLALCSGDTVLDFVAYAGYQFSHTASTYPGGPQTGVCGVGSLATLIGSSGATPSPLAYPDGTTTASVGRYGTGNRIADYQWGVFTGGITEDALNAGPCISVIGAPNPACRQNFGNAEDTTPPPPSPSQTTPTPSPTGPTACVGHYDECPENCGDVRYHIDVHPSDDSPDRSCRDEAGLRVFEGTAKQCVYGDGSCRTPDCILHIAPRGAQAGSCADPTHAGSRCTVGCATDYYRAVQATEQPTCDCSALESLPSNHPDCNLAWSNTQATATCIATNECSFDWQPGYHGVNQDIMITNTGEGFCQPLAECHPDTQYIFREPDQTTADPSSPTGAYTSNRVCRDISPCDVYGEYQSVAPSPGVPGVAAGWDRQCLPLSVCTAGQYEQTAPLRPPTADPSQPNTGDRHCATLTVCRPNEFEDTPPQRDPRALDPRNAPYLTNRVCLPCRACDMSQYIRTECSDTADTVCVPLTECAPGEWEEEAPALDQTGTTYTTNRHCGTTTARCTDEQYERQTEIQTGYTDDSTQTWVEARPRICEDMQGCAEDEYEPIDTRNSRTCETMQETGATSLYCAERVCLPLTPCPDGQYQSVPPPLCTPGQSNSGNCGDRYCNYWSDPCDPATQYQAREPTSTNDRECLPLSTCRQRQWAPPLVAGHGQNLVDRNCADWHQCPAGNYQVSPGPSETVDRQCRPWSTCGADEYESHPPEPMQLGGWSLQDRHCQPLSPACQPVCANGNCPAGAQFQFAAPTTTTNRDCRPVKESCEADEWQTSAPTWNSDRGCSAHRICASDEHQSVAPTPTSDRQCEKISGSAGATGGGEDSGDDGSPGGVIGAVVALLGGGGAGGGVMWHKQQKRKREGLLAEKNAPEEIELDDFK